MEDEVCNVCFGKVETKPYLCPFCSSGFHKEHLAAWLFMQPHCPVCRNEMPSRILTELAPKTQQEAEDMTKFYNYIQTKFKQDLATLETIAKKKNKQYFEKLKKEQLKKIKEEERLRTRAMKENEPLWKKLLPIAIFLGWMLLLIAVLY